MKAPVREKNREKNLLTFSIDRDIVLQKFVDREDGMEFVKISPKYQVVIPKKVRRSLKLRPGQKMQVISFQGRIELIPERKISEMKGFLKGINTEVVREEDRE